MTYEGVPYVHSFQIDISQRQLLAMAAGLAGIVLALLLAGSVEKKTSYLILTLVNELTVMSGSMDLFVPYNVK